MDRGSFHLGPHRAERSRAAQALAAENEVVVDVIGDDERDLGAGFADGNETPFAPEVFDLRGVAFAAWTLAAFAIGAFALCAILSMLLPRTAVSEEALTES